MGFSCDTVLNFQIVLAFGALVNANATSHIDLFKALKGSSNNFGIVTRVDMKPVQQSTLWGGAMSHNMSTREAQFRYLEKFANTDLNKDTASNLHLLFAQQGGVWFNMNTLTNIDGVSDAPAFTGIKTLPALTDTTRIDNVTAFANEFGGPQGSQG